MRAIVVDSGPLIALFNGSDRYHQRVTKWLASVDCPLYTNLAVITEVVHLLGFHRQAATDFLQWIHQAGHIDKNSVDDWPRITEVFRRYADLPADFADASLVALCERLETRRICTIDDDFYVYRFKNRYEFQLEPL